MRRVVVTGMGIVSSIGNNNAKRCWPACAKRSPASSPRPNTPSSASAARCTADRSSIPRDVVDKRVMRFMGDGTGCTYIAMEQAIADAGLREDDVSNERTGLIVGSGGPSPRAIVEAADTAREKGAKRVGPFAVPKAMSSTTSATLATPFKIKGVNYSISSACATSRPLHRQRLTSRSSGASRT